jgi:hypothetical protein
LSKGECLVFLKFYNPEDGTLRYIGNAWCQKSTTIKEISNVAKQRLGLPEEEKLNAWEEITIRRQDVLKDDETLDDAELGKWTPPYEKLTIRHRRHYSFSKTGP